MEPKILFVLGCGEGSIPPRPETGSLLSEQERMVLRDQLHIALAPDSFRSMEKQLFLVYCAFTEKSLKEAEDEFEGKGYGDFKLAVGETVADVIDPIRLEKNRILEDKQYIDSVLKSGAERAERLAGRTLAKVYKKVGLVPRARG